MRGYREWTINPYGSRLIVTGGEDRKWIYDQYVKRHGANPGLLRDLSDRSCVGQVATVLEKDTKRFVLSIFEFSHDTVAHESTHAAVYVLDHAGVKFSTANHEHLAYLVGHIADLVYKTLQHGKKD